MPAYLSHAIMGNELYKKSSNDEKIFKSQVNKNSLKTYSLGIDLSHFLKGTGDIHSIKTQEFLLNLIQYVKENNLTENEEVLAFLYGHIGHYFFDTNSHPLIYYIEKGCDKVGLIGNHTMVEGFLDSYMCEKILKENYMNVGASFFNKANLNNPKIIKLLKEVYTKTYSAKNAASSYQNVLRMLATLETCTKSPVVTKDFLVKFASFEKYLEINNLTRGKILNIDKNTWRVPLTGEKHNESFVELYNKALEMTMYAISKVNGYLYDGESILTLYELFPNISYDTGVDISLGYTFTYTRRNK